MNTDVTYHHNEYDYICSLLTTEFFYGIVIHFEHHMKSFDLKANRNYLSNLDKLRLLVALTIHFKTKHQIERKKSSVFGVIGNNFINSYLLIWQCRLNGNAFIILCENFGR